MEVNRLVSNYFTWPITTLNQICFASDKCKGLSSYQINKPISSNQPGS